MSSRDTWVLMLGGVIAFAGCSRAEHRDSIALNGGNADRGKATMLRYGCNACHAVAGLPDPTVIVAAPITGIGERSYIAGILPNTPENLVMWIRFPHSVTPATAMPDLGVSASEARDIATYLYSLR